MVKWSYFSSPKTEGKEHFKSLTKTRMKQKLLAVLLLGFFACTSAFAQNRTITGKVADAQDGLPLPGVSVKVKGTTTGTTTDATGEFRVSAAQNAVLQFSYIGYVTREVNVGENTSLTIKLTSD